MKEVTKCAKSAYRYLVAGLILLALMWIPGTPALRLEVSADDCTAITSLPFVITAPGKYCLASDLSFAGGGTAIGIQASNVLLDLNGFTLFNVDSTQGIGIASVFNQKSLTVRNGTIKGFTRAIDFYSSSVTFATIETLRIQDSLDTGIAIQGTGNIIRNNQIFNTQNPSGAIGIQVGLGTGNALLNNDIVDTVGTAGTGVAEGIVLVSDRSIIENNRIEHTTGVPGYAIFVGSFASNVIVVNNRIVRADFGIRYQGSGLYRDNITLGCTTPYTGGTNGGNNQ